jgi:hypothetical protein
LEVALLPRRKVEIIPQAFFIIFKYPFDDILGAKMTLTNQDPNTAFGGKIWYIIGGMLAILNSPSVE